MRNTTIVLAALLSLTSAALADDTQTAPQPAAATPDQDKKVCRTIYHDGSLIRTQQCKTQREWDSLRTEQQRQVTNMQTSGYRQPH